MITAKVGFTAQQRTVISGAFEIADRTLREIVVPRRDVVALPASPPAGEGVQRLVTCAHSRAPVTGPLGLDDVLGIVQLRDLVHADGLVGEQTRPALLLPETLGVSEALREMRRQRQQFALVIDELGEVDGIVTLEDLVEEIVGDIYDEADHDVQAVVHEPNNTMLVWRPCRVPAGRVRRVCVPR